MHRYVTHRFKGEAIPFLTLYFFSFLEDAIVLRRMATMSTIKEGNDLKVACLFVRSYFCFIESVIHSALKDIINALRHNKRRTFLVMLS